MQESTPNPSRPEALTGKEFEVGRLVAMSRYVQDMIENERGTRGYGADYGHDILGAYCAALAERDPEIGHMLVEAFETPSDLNPEPDLELSHEVRMKLGLPNIIDVPNANIQ